MPQGRAKITFDRDHEIISLDGSISQAVDLANHYPSISSPASGDLYTRLLNALQEGGHWIAVDPVGSDLPMIAVYDGALLNKPNRPELQAGFVENLVVIGHEPVFVEKAMKKPLVIPPLARYIYGDADAAALVNLGGEGDAGLIDVAAAAYVSDYFSFRVLLKFGKTKWEMGSDIVKAYRYRLKKGIYTPGTGITAYYAYSPYIVKNSDRLFYETHPMAAVGGTVGCVENQSSDTNDTSGQSLATVSTDRTAIATPGGPRFRFYFSLTDAVAGPASFKQYHMNRFLTRGLYQ